MSQRRTLALVACAAACGGPDGNMHPDMGVQRGHVDVFAYLAEEPGQVPATGATVIFQDLDGSSRSTTVDGSGHAEGEIEPGGTVWLARYTAMTFGSNLFTAYTDVQPDATLVFGPPAPPAQGTAAGTITFTGGPTTTYDFVHVYATCGRSMYGDNILTYTTSCGSTVDVLAVAYDYVGMSNYLTAGYAFLEDVAAVDASTVAIPMEAWKDADEVTFDVANASGITLEYMNVTNDFGITASAYGSPLKARLPLVGSGLRLDGTLREDLTGYSNRQVFAKHAPLAPSISLDVAGIVAPWVQQPTTNFQPWSWQQNDSAGALRADAMITEYRWQQPKANYMEGELVQILSAPRAPGDLPLPQLPAELAADQPGSDFQVNAKVRLLRIKGLSNVDPMRFAEQLTRNPLGSLRLEEVTTGSVAATE